VLVVSSIGASSFAIEPGLSTSSSVRVEAHTIGFQMRPVWNSGGMLHARKAGWRSRYEIALDGHPLTVWDGGMWRTGGTFILEGQRFDVRGNLWGSAYGMADGFGNPVAQADRVGRKRWTVASNGQVYEFRRKSFWSTDQQLMLGDTAVGHVYRAGRWRSEAVAELPGLPLPLQVFVLVVIITVWELNSAAIAASS
jgi:hypothetical protein